MKESNHKTALIDQLKGLFRKEWLILLAAMPVFWVLFRVAYRLFAGESFAMHWTLGNLVPLVFVLAFLYWLAQKGPDLLPRYMVAEYLPGLGAVGLSAGLVLLIHFLKPMQFVDDAGFILRYLDNVKDGCFYCFNAEDGPVFGVSGFLYGLVGMVLVGSGLFSPEGALTFMTYLGLFCSSLLLLAILKKLINRPAYTFLLWIFVMTMCNSFLNVSNSGMESIFHLSVCLSAVWFFLIRKDWAMWAFLALATISKLSAVPLVLVVAALWFWENRSGFRPISLKNEQWRPLLLAGLAPVALYILVTILLFGSPLPQSAHTKMYLHAHAEGSWFPFLQYFWDSPLRHILFLLFLISFFGQVAFGLFARDQQIIRESVFGFAALGILLLYYFFNPGERMVWYYVEPEFFMLAHLVLAWGRLLSLMPGAGGLYVLAGFVGLWMVFTATHVKKDLQWFDRYVKTVEGERLEIGKVVAGYTTEKDSLLSGHGLISRRSPGYVIDRTGLNSRLALQYGLDFEKIMTALKPGWVVLHGWNTEVDRINRGNYRLMDSWYDITLYQYPSWRLFERVNPELAEELRFLKAGEIEGKGLKATEDGKMTRIIGEEYRFRRPTGQGEQRLIFGVYKKDKDFSLSISQFSGDSLIRNESILVSAFEEGPGYRPHTVKVGIPLGKGSSSDRIIVRREGIEDLVEIVDPAFVLSR